MATKGLALQHTMNLHYSETVSDKLGVFYVPGVSRPLIISPLRSILKIYSSSSAARHGFY